MPAIALRRQRVVSGLMPASTGGLRHVTREASFKGKAAEESPTSVGRRRFVVVAGERRIQCTRSGYTAQKHSSEPRNHSG
jgi:hypothetical protein